jgi:hypothetical protein
MPSRFLLRLLLLSTLLIAPLWYAIALKWPIVTDILFYATAINSFSAQFWSGDLYPRWLTDINGGLGAPVFLFYGPLSYYLASLLAWLAPFDPHGFGRLALMLHGALVAAGCTSYFWLRRDFPEAQAQRGALIYACFPFIPFILYLIFGMATLWAVALLPLLLLAARNLGAAGRCGIVKLSMAYGLLALTHLPTTLAFSLVPLAYAVASSEKGRRFHALSAATASALLGALLAAFYLLPAAANKPFIASERFLEGKLNYANAFHDPGNYYSILLIGGLLAALFLEIPRSRWRELVVPQTRFWLGALAIILYLVTPLSMPLWQALPFMAYLQYPGRFLVAAIPVSLWLYISWLPYARNQFLHVWLTGIILVLMAFYSFNSFFFHSDRPVRRVLAHSLNVAPEYITSWMKKEGIAPLTLDDALLAMPQARFVSGSGKAEITGWQSRRIDLRATVTSPTATLALKRFYFPGWKTGMPGVTVEPRQSLLAVTLPRGRHELTLEVPYFAGERQGLTISGLALLVWAALFISCLRTSRRANIT